MSNDTEGIICLALAKSLNPKEIQFEQHQITENNEDLGPTKQKEWPYKWEKKISTYTILNAPDYIPIKDLEVAAKYVFKKIWKEIPLDFIFSKDDPNADFKINFVEADDVFEKNPLALAYAYLPRNNSSKNGIIVFSLKYIWGMVSKFKNNKRIYNFYHVLLHEVLHALGLLHDEHDDTSDVMDPVYNGKNLELSEWDKYRLKLMHGNRIFKSWWHYSRWDKLLKILVRRE